MSYISGFVAAVPTDKRDAFLAHARNTADVFKEYGALRVVDAWGADVPDGSTTSFPMAVKAEPNETVVFSWVEWPSKDVCDTGMAALMEDPRMAPEANPMPFDGKRLIWGNFETLNDA
ncbi:MAG: DUF1428 domain-containing protein [Pseudomonadota bacterium]